jgi:hypothetical protein
MLPTPEYTHRGIAKITRQGTSKLELSNQFIYND